jgi:hypothetical protein
MTRLLACIALLQGVALGACEHDCVLKADPVPEAISYRVCVVQEWNDANPIIHYPDGIDCVLTDEPTLDIRNTPLDRDDAVALAWKAQDSQGRESLNWSNIVWFNLACLRANPDCEYICEAGGVHELSERYERCEEDE